MPLSPESFRQLATGNPFPRGTISHRTRHLDRVLDTKKPTIWVVTAMVVILGAVLFFSLGRSERQRQSAVAEIAIGAPAESATAAIGVDPLTCSGESLDHLALSFPEGWSPAAIELALGQLEMETKERWVYPLDPGQPASCNLAEEQTEVGVAENGTVLWTVAVDGRTPLTLPPSMSPEGLFAAGTNQ